ncbi:hypothetical protein ACFLWB_00270 [Chloroflexota bacterium]
MVFRWENTRPRQIIRYNQVVVGSVNSNRSHFEMALRDMDEINQRFNNILDKVLTHRFRLEEYKEVFSLQDPNRIKSSLRCSYEIRPHVCSFLRPYNRMISLFYC